MTITAEGKHGPMPFSVFEDLVRGAATKAVSFSFEKEGAQRGLPPNVATVTIGDPDRALDGEPGDVCWWNVRRGELPEESQFSWSTGALTDVEEAQLAALKAPNVHSSRDNPFVYRTNMPEHAIRRRIARLENLAKPRKRLLHLGWRPVLFSMLTSGYLRRTAALDEWLGLRDGDQARAKSRILAHEVSAPVREAITFTFGDE